MEIYRALAGTCILLGTSASLGYAFLPSTLKLPLFIKISFSIIILSFITAFLGFIHYLRPGIIHILYGCIFVLSLIIIYTKQKKQSFTLPNIKKNHSLSHLNFIHFIILIYFIVLFVNTLTPPISRDALNYHLLLPKIWLSEGKITTISENIYSFFPSYWECFLTSAIVIGNDITPKLLHLLYLVFLCLLLKNSLKEFSPPNWTEFLILIFIATPVINKIASWAYLDLTFSFYGLGALFLLVKYHKENNNAYFWLSSLFTGYTIGIKYLGLVWLICLLPFFAYQKQRLKAVIIPYGKYILFALIAGSPFYIRNWIVTGNPFFPFLGHIFHSHLICEEKYQLLLLYFNSYGQGKSLLDLLLLPFRLLFVSDFENPEGFDGKLNILYALGIILLFKREKSKAPRYLFLIFLSYTLFWFYLSQQMRFFIPALFLLLLIYGLYLPNSWRKLFKFIIPTCCLFYLKYPLNDLLTLKSYRYVLGLEDRKIFLSRNLKIYPFLDYINKTLTAEDKIMLLDMGAIGYYLNIPIYQETVFEDYTFKSNLDNLNQLREYLKQNKVTHILLDLGFINKYLIPTLNDKQKKNFQLFFCKDLQLISRYYNWCLFRLNF